MAIASLAFMLGMKKGMLLRSTSEIQTWKSNETILSEELHSVPDITVTILDPSGKPDTGHVINGEQAIR
jgi:hypothetical protein